MTGMPSPKRLPLLARWKARDRYRSRAARLQAARRRRADAPPADQGTIARHARDSDDRLFFLQNAVEAMRLGAYHYVNKPFNLDEVALTVEKALETSRLRREVRSLRATQSREHGFDAIIGASPAIVRQNADGARGHEPGVHRASYRRDGHGQGPGGEGDPLQQRTRGAAIREHHGIRASRTAPRERALRP